MITLKIDVTKIDKKRLYKGQKGTYLSCVMIETPNSEYGDYMIVEETTKEEREAGTKGTILGNAKVLKPKSDLDRAEENIASMENGIDEKSNLPF